MLKDERLGCFWCIPSREPVELCWLQINYAVRAERTSFLKLALGRKPKLMCCYFVFPPQEADPSG